MTKSSRRLRFDEVSENYQPPAAAVRLAERRVGGFVERFNWHQTFSAEILGSRPRPTLLDLVVSAYLQGVTDCAQAFAHKGIEWPSDEGGEG